VAPNIHYFGQQQYADLPAFLKGFDIATMPFALNEATRFISPTKTLEYLAGGKPVISSSVPDVVALYGEIVHIVDGPDAWMREIDKILVAPEQDRQARLARATEILARSSWDSIAEQMWTLMHEQLVQKP
jgi:glycosyltransferase involved in cell wall biosynthesis